MIFRLTLETDCQSSRQSCYMCIIKSCNKQHSKGNHTMFTPVLNGYDVIIMIMSLYFHCWEYCCIAVLLSLFLTKFWCCMQLNMPLNFSLFQHKTWEEKIHTAFEEADCQTYTHMCPSVPLPAPQQSLTPYPTPHDSRPRLTLQRQGNKRGRVRKRNPKHHVEPKWKVAFSSTDTSEMVERMPAGFALCSLFNLNTA